MDEPTQTRNPMTIATRLATRTALLAVVGSLTPGCAHRPPALSAPAGMPQVGWVIMYGDSDNPDAEFACQSNPLSGCVIPASQPAGEPTLSDVHLYFHPGLSQTNYSGRVNIGFFGNAPGGHEIKPVIAVSPGAVGNNSVVGIVTDRPGAQALDIDITVTTAAGEQQQIRERVPVIVR